MQNYCLQNVHRETDTSLPILIKLLQTAKTGALINSFEIADKAGDVGGDSDALGGIFGFSIDCKHKCLDESSETDNFRELNNIYKTYSSPMISKEFITDRFYIIEIPDFSHQAVSNGYVDFVPYVYKEGGAKIPQKYVGMIKSYTNKTCYVLLDKDKPTSANSYSIIIKFKKNYEAPSESNSSIAVSNNSGSGSNNKTIMEYTGKDDYSYFEGNINVNNENYLYPSYISELKTDDLVRRQSGKNFTIETENNAVNDGEYYDYFATVFELDYNVDASNTPKLTKKRSTGSLDTIRLQRGSSSAISAISKQDIYEFIQSTDFSRSNYANLFSYPEEFNVFNTSDGHILAPGIDYTVIYDNNNRFITGVNIISQTPDIEIIPEFNSQRKLRISGTAQSTIIVDETWIRKVLKKLGLIRYDRCIINENTTSVYIEGCLKPISSTAYADDKVVVLINDSLETTSVTEVNSDNINLTFAGSERSGSLYPEYKDFLNPFNNSYSGTTTRIITPTDEKRIYENDITGGISYHKDGNEYIFTKEPNSANPTNLGVSNYITRMGYIMAELSNDNNNLKTAINDTISTLSSNFYKIFANSYFPSFLPYNNGDRLDGSNGVIFYVIEASTIVPSIDISLLENTIEVQKIPLSSEGTIGANSYFIIPVFWKFKSDTDVSNNLNNLSIALSCNGATLKYYGFGGGGI